MNLFLAALVVFALVMAGMAVGVICSNRRIKGSCGGLSAMSDEFGEPFCECGAAPGSCSTSEETRSEPPSEGKDEKAGILIQS